MHCFTPVLIIILMVTLLIVGICCCCRLGRIARVLEQMKS